MNYLAHAYLSFGKPPVLAGNMVSDFIKGKKQFDFDIPIQRGIRLHRAIDEFTDSHPAIKEMKKPFTPAFGLYAGVFTDIVCDYFLANDTCEFPTVKSLTNFSKNTYGLLDKQLPTLPLAFQNVFAYMKHYDWLSNYRNQWAIEKSFAGIGKRARYMKKPELAFSIFENNIEIMKPCYDDFFPLLKEYAVHTLKELEMTV